MLAAADPESMASESDINDSIKRLAEKAGDMTENDWDACKAILNQLPIEDLLIFRGCLKILLNNRNESEAAT